MNFEKPEKSVFLKNEKKLLEISSFYTCVPKTTIMWDTVPKMQSETELLSFWAIFCLFNSLHLNNSEKQSFEKMKKAFGDVIILNLCNKKHDHMMYAYSDMECLHRHNFLSFQAIFCSFAPLLTPEIKICNKCKKSPGDIILLHMCTINQDHMMYGSWDMKFNRQNFFVILGNFLSFYPPNTLKNENIKNVKNHWRYHHFTQVYQKSWSSAILFQRYGAWRM